MSDDLSRLLAGDLDPAEADALRARIAADPALAERWAVMQALPGRLRGLPREWAPPVGVGLPGVHGAGAPPPQRPRQVGAAPLDPRKAAIVPPRRPWGTLVGAFGVGAAAALAAVWLAPAPEHVLVSGTEVVRGRAEVLAGGVVVAVDGTARITVEPPPDAGRDVDAENDPMDRTHLAAALAGSLVTVTVAEGRAWLRPADAPTAEVADPIDATPVAAGETRRVGGPDARHAAKERPPRGAEGQDARIASLEAELARLRQAQGAPGRPDAPGRGAVPWPADVGAAWRPEAFERLLDARAAAIPGVEVVDVDCEEYPCVAVFHTTSESDDWEDELRPLTQGLEPSFGPDLAVIALAWETATEDGDARLYGFAVAPADAPDDLRGRVQERTRANLTAASEALLGK